MQHQVKQAIKSSSGPLKLCCSKKKKKELEVYETRPQYLLQSKILIIQLLLTQYKRDNHGLKSSEIITRNGLSKIMIDLDGKLSVFDAAREELLIADV